MSPNIWSCDADWFKRLKDNEEKVVVAGWCGKDEKCNQWVEGLTKLEEEGVPIFVCDVDSCPSIAESLGIKKGGETVVFAHGEEKGRLSPSDNMEGDLETVRGLTK